MYRYLFVFVFLFAFVGAKAQIDITTHRNKQDSLNMKQDSLSSKPFAPKPSTKVKTYHPDSTHSPRKAVMRSLYFAGLGQIYNHHGLWWRLPALYTGLGFLVYNIYTNGRDYNLFLKESVWRASGRPFPKDAQGNQSKDSNGNLITGEPLPTYYSGGKIINLTNVDDQTIYAYKDNLRRNRDLSIFSFIGVWGVQMIDAYVEAKFIHSYTMDSNLSFKVTPSLMGSQPGMPVYASNFNTTFTPSIKLTLFLK